jgi:AcrR family transcriptional regulator
VDEVVKGAPRNRRARQTRQRVVAAASELFIADGYAPTTLEQVAAHAGVSVQTVYFHFGNKRTLLKQAVDVAAVGDDEPVPLLDRPWLDEVRAETEPRRLVERWLANSRAILGRVGPIMGVVRDAADADPEMAAQWATNEEQRAAAYRMLAELLEERSALRVPVDEATDILCALLGLEVYLLLARRGWNPQRWQRWAEEMVAAALLRPQDRD